MRFFISLIIGLVVAGALFLLMRSFITGQQTAPSDAEMTELVSFISAPEPPEIQRKNRDVPEEPEPEQPPPQAPDVQVSKEQQINTPNIDINIPDIGVPTPGAGGSGPFIGGGYSVASSFRGNGRAIPIVLIKPSYPRKALFDNTSGTVVAEFTVQPDGSATDIEIIKAEPTRVFNNVVRNALRRSKFKPKIVNGKPVAARYTYSYHFEPPNQR